MGFINTSPPSTSPGDPQRLCGSALCWREGASAGLLPLKGERAGLGSFIVTQKSLQGLAVF